MVYENTRKMFGLKADQVCCSIAKVSDSYKKSKKNLRKFKPLGAMEFNKNIFRINVDKQVVSIATIGKRLKLTYQCGERQHQLLEFAKNAGKLKISNKHAFFYVYCEIPCDTTETDGFLGIDRGIKNIAVDSEGNFYSGEHVWNRKQRYQKLRSELQSKQTKSAKRKLRKISGKEKRFMHDVNHCISKQIVQTAKHSCKTIVLEKLDNIRHRVKVSRKQRSTIHQWSYYDLAWKIEYKSKIERIDVVFVDPRNTSRTCPSCGFVDKKNRRTQSNFSCVQCGFAGHADHIAAINIAARGAVNHPIVSTASR
ncbi:transposase [Candidatus Pacearchaeota archaeon]|nr:MAG: transposase [Candidatus Pacearchaeota archaeon]